MGGKNISEFLYNLSPDLKKEILQTLVASLIEGLEEKEQKEILQSALTSSQKSRELIDMVGH
jgi:hypothetical protein